MTREGSIRVGDRTITYLEAGDPGGPLVLHNHGGPSSRLEAELFDPYAKANGLRFVCADRPGMGGSDLQPGRTFEGWTDDLLLLADSFGAQRFAVTGWSEGGPWALAAAAYLEPRAWSMSCASPVAITERSDRTGPRSISVASTRWAAAWRFTSIPVSHSCTTCSVSVPHISRIVTRRRSHSRRAPRIGRCWLTRRSSARF